MTHTDTEANLIVIGAGLSGLESARTLEENGLRVTVLEGRRRIGGRLYTLLDLPGQPEVGGNTVSRA
jgi:monoamine oxidase